MNARDKVELVDLDLLLPIRVPFDHRTPNGTRQVVSEEDGQLLVVEGKVVVEEVDHVVVGLHGHLVIVQPEDGRRIPQCSRHSLEFSNHLSEIPVRLGGQLFGWIVDVDEDSLVLLPVVLLKQLVRYPQGRVVGDDLLRVDLGFHCDCPIETRTEEEGRQEEDEDPRPRLGQLL